MKFSFLSPGAPQVLCSCLHDARVQRVNKTWHLLAKSDIAARCAFNATSWHAPRSGGRRAPKGLEPFGTPQCVFVGAALSLRATRRKITHLQCLRLQVKKLANMEVARKMQQQKLLLLFNAPFDSSNFPQNGKQKLLLPPPAARAVLSRGTALKVFMRPLVFLFVGQQRSGFQRRQPLADFLSSFLCSATKKGH
ncbi:MAG: hypothetical protein E7625_03365 [Ruminococcaceae bacterium]|nr:hypothetical protein [Oscillospiraceae bacterium]